MVNSSVVMYACALKNNFNLCECYSASHKNRICFAYKIFSELFPFVRVCLCERNMLKIQYLLQIYKKRIVKTNEGNEMMIQ